MSIRYLKSIMATLKELLSSYIFIRVTLGTHPWPLMGWVNIKFHMVLMFFKIFNPLVCKNFLNFINSRCFSTIVRNMNIRLTTCFQYDKPMLNGSTSRWPSWAYVHATTSSHKCNDFRILDEQTNESMCNKTLMN